MKQAEDKWNASISDRDMDAVFTALAHETRRRILDCVKENPGAAVGEIAAHFDVSRIAVMKHLAVLEQADLLISQKDGRTRRLYFNAAPIQMIYDRWTTDYSAYWAGELTRLKYLAEARASELHATPAKRGSKND
ncbi:MAG: metalloregulator ArsR/SmtB family transcription factor [Parvularculaceae bacterium]